MKPNVHAGRLERRVRRVGKETMPGVHGFCSFFPFGAIRLTSIALGGFLKLMKILN